MAWARLLGAARRATASEDVVVLAQTAKFFALLYCVDRYVLHVSAVGPLLPGRVAVVARP